MWRIKSEVWVKAYIRRCYASDVPAVVVYRGDADAGAIYIKLNELNGEAKIYGPAPQGLGGIEFERRWCLFFGGEGQSEDACDRYIKKQRDRDQDLWLVEIEDASGRHFLGDELVRFE